MSLQVYIGPMFGGKTSILLKELAKITAIGLSGVYINHSSDRGRRTVTDGGFFTTHNQLIKSNVSSISFISCDNLMEIIKELPSFSLICIDEGQFFPDLFDAVGRMVEEMKLNVIVAGLDATAKKAKFGQLLDIVLIADRVEKICPYCKTCANDGIKKDAIFTRKIGGDENLEIDIGAGEKYIPVCREHYH